jgi:hypothetical protein
MSEQGSIRLPTGANEMAVTSSFAFAPTNLEQAMRFSAMIANSDLVPKDYVGKPGNVLIAIQMGAEVGLAPMQAIQGIAVINGRPAVWGDAALALVRAHPSVQSITEAVEGTGKSAVATCVVKRLKNGVIESTSRSFSWDDAVVANLSGKRGPWTDYPMRMLQMRARGFALRDAAADVLKGLAIAEEAMDIPGRDVQNVTPTQTRAEQVRAALSGEPLDPKAAVVSQDLVNEAVQIEEDEARQANAELDFAMEAAIAEFLDGTKDLDDTAWSSEIGALVATRGLNRDEFLALCERATGKSALIRRNAEAIVRALYVLPRVEVTE